MSWNITGAPGTGEDLLYSQAGTPTLDLRFASSKSLNDYLSGQNLITYTRAGDATFFDANGTIQTAGANTPRFDHDPATGESLGLLIEEARTNLLLNSETLSTQSVTVTAAAHTLSFYGTGTVTLSGTHSATVVGTGAFPTRTTLTFTPTSGSLTVTVSGTVQYGQVELGAFATSWISTGGATATRSQDFASIPATVFQKFFVPSPASWLLEAYPISTVANATYIEGFEGAGLRGMTIAVSAGTGDRVRLIQRHGPSRLDSGSVGSAVTPFQRFRASVGVSDSSIGYVNNENVTVGTPPQANWTPLSGLSIGSRAVGSLGACTFILSRLCIFDRRLPNATLQAITA
jgi:hypothetical protein